MDRDTVDNSRYEVRVRVRVRVRDTVNNSRYEVALSIWYKWNMRPKTFG